ncbi:MAG: hypothetical protein FWD37_07015 [Methanomassiliicoccaceae archaeon]|nr:hypothetical protein [Methanomassiliicoccaceae archaeon]
MGSRRGGGSAGIAAIVVAIGTGLVLLISFIVNLLIRFKIPQRKFEVDISGKRSMDESKLLTIYLETYGTGALKSHLIKVDGYIQKKFEKCKGNPKKIGKIELKYEKTKHRAFHIVGTRTYTGTVQRDNVKYSNDSTVNSVDIWLSREQIRDILGDESSTYTVSYNH